MAKRADIHRVRVRGIHKDARDLPRVFKTDMLPGRAAILAAVHAIPRSQVGADVGFASADVDHLRIGRRDCERADRCDWLRVEQRLPNGARILGLPYAAIHSAEEEFLSAPRHTAHRDNAAAAKRS